LSFFFNPGKSNYSDVSFKVSIVIKQRRREARWTLARLGANLFDMEGDSPNIRPERIIFWRENLILLSIFSRRGQIPFLPIFFGLFFFVTLPDGYLPDRYTRHDFHPKPYISFF
jgi:hypothetical protein